MNDDLEGARAAVQRAIESTDDATLREHLRSVDEGLMELTTDEADADSGADAKTQGDEPLGDDLESVEAEIVDVASETDERTRSHLEDARDEIDEYRRAYTQDW